MTTPSPASTPLLRTARHGFTLVETALALGIVSFAMVAMMGLLAMGMDHSRGNLERTMEAQIVEWVQAQAREAYEEGALTISSAPASYYFDSDGLAVKATDPALAQKTLFRAVTEPFETTLPGSTEKLFGVSVTITAARNNERIGSHALWF